MNLGFDVVSTSVPPAPKVRYESTADCGKLTIGSLPQTYGVIRTCQLHSSRAGASAGPKPLPSAVAREAALETISATAPAHNVCIFIALLPGRRGGIAALGARCATVPRRVFGRG